VRSYPLLNACVADDNFDQVEPVYSHDDREVSAAWPTFSDCITPALLFAGELAGSVTQEVGSADKFRDLRSAAAVGTGAGGLARAGAGTGDRTGWIGRRICAVCSMGLGQATVELQVSSALLL
jgi:hypothetical protein